MRDGLMGVLPLKIYCYQLRCCEDGHGLGLSKWHAIQSAMHVWLYDHDTLSMCATHLE